MNSAKRNRPAIEGWVSGVSAAPPRQRRGFHLAAPRAEARNGAVREVRTAPSEGRSYRLLLGVTGGRTGGGRLALAHDQHGAATDDDQRDRDARDHGAVAAAAGLGQVRAVVGRLLAALRR